MACGPGQPGRGALSGVVRASSSGAPVAGARVVAAWDEDGRRAERVASTDAAGVYRLCALPAAIPLRIAAAAGEVRAASRELTLEPQGAAQQDLTLQGAAVALRASPGTLALRLSPGAGEEGAVAGARISIVGTTHAATTDARGVATIAGLGAGRYVVAVDPAEGGRFMQPIEMGPGGLALELTLGGPQGAVALAPVVGVGRTATEIARRSSGARQMVMTRADIASVEAGKRNVVDLIRGRFSGVHVTEFTDRNGRQSVCVGSSRGVSSFTRSAMPIGCNPVGVVLDGMKLPQADAAETLLRLPLMQIESVEYLNSSEAALRFGTSSDQAQATGFLVVYTRGMGPHRAP
jgi:hypothetical protein